MDYLNSLSGITRKFIIATVAFLLYGYLCRLVGLYFFWESKTVGWLLFWITVILILRDRIKTKKLLKKAATFEKICVGVSIFIIILKGIYLFAIPQTSAFDKAFSYIKLNQGLLNEVGTVKSVFLVPIGSFSMKGNDQGTTGQADLYFIVKGSKKYVDLNLLMAKDFDTDWIIEINH